MAQAYRMDLVMRIAHPAGRWARVAALLEARPGRALAIFAVVHAALWTALPSLLFANLPLDLIEALTYGREWQLGYDKLPPLPWWMVESARKLAGTDVAYYLIAQSAVLATLALVFGCGRRIVGTTGAFAAVLIADGLHYLNFTAAKFNHDVIQLPFWALAGASFHAALRTGRMIHWVLLGAALGAALWAKYFVVVLAVPLGLFLLLDPRARPALATAGPYVAAAVALAVASPHLGWLVAHDFLPFGYAAGRAAAVRGPLDHLLRPLAFAAGQLLWLVPSLLIAWPLFRRNDARVAPTDAFDRRIVTLLAFGPAALLVAGSAVSGRGLIAMWGYPLWLFVGLWLVIATRTALSGIRLGLMTATWGVVTALYAVAFIAGYAVLPSIDHRYRAVLFPGERLAATISRGFEAATGRPLVYVIGSMWVGGNVGVYAPGRPRTVIDGQPSRSPWIDIDDVRRRGAAVVWSDGNPRQVPPALAAIAEGAEVQPPFTLPMRRGGGQLEFGWAIVKPHEPRPEIRP